MGKKTRKTRWRTLAIADESDSEESNTVSRSQLSKDYHHRPFYSKFTYSSQSTPTRRFPYEPKSTRSSSTASETKITFNEDEYTKITTPRQDVLFKKGYLNKPKNYQTQTSTGNSTASTGNSTGNGTPDHQSADGTEGTDLEYESQFVFPNAFVDQNGIYYINSYEHYPLLMYNPAICYPEYPLSRTKRHSTGSLTESTSPHTEETSQDLSQSGGENTGNGPEFNQVYNVVYPGYYYNGVCSPNVTTNGQAATEPRKIKKKRRRKISKSINQEDSTSSEDGYSSDEDITQVENRNQNNKTTIFSNGSISTSETTAYLRLEENLTTKKLEGKKTSDEGTERLQDNKIENQKEINLENTPTLREIVDEDNKSKNESPSRQEEMPEGKIIETSSELTNEETLDDMNNTSSSDVKTDSLNLEEEHEISAETNTDTKNAETSETSIKESKFNLNAEEFVPRAYRNVEPLPVDSNLQFINIHPNFVPVPLISHPELNNPPFNSPFLPPGIPLNFIPTDPKLMPNFINFVPNHFIPMKPYEQPSNTTETKQEETTKENNEQEKPTTAEIKTETIITENTIKENPEKQEERKEEIVELERSKCIVYKTDVDIAKIVSKLEEAAKEQKSFENRRQNFRSPNKYNKIPRQRFNSPYEQSYQNEYKSFDKRRPRRYENKPNENTGTKPKETADTQKELTKHPEIFENTSKEVQTDLQIKTEVSEIPSKSTEDEKNYSPKHPNYKNHNSPRRYINYNRNNRGRTPEISYSAPTSNYSDSLKKPPYGKSCPRFEKNLVEKSISFIKPTPTRKIVESTNEITKITPPSNKSSQWISVSNKKKRKNKSSNDDETVEETSFDTTEEVFDILEITESKEKTSEITENIVTAENVDKIENLTINNIDTFIEMITSKESSPIKICSNTDIPNNKVHLQDVKDIEKELLRGSMKIETIETDTAKDITEMKQIESLPIQQQKCTKDMRKKSKKGNQKSSGKRIIILDPDTSKKENQNQDKSRTKIDLEILTKEENISKKVVEIHPPNETDTISCDKPIENISMITEEIKNDVCSPLEISADNTSTPDKKKSKKKKKQVKPILSTSIPSASSSSTTLNNMDDSYDFLLDTTALVDEKTNIEVSEELDKMIQKGLFGNLEEKFRSLNVSVDDDFFKSLNIKPNSQTTQDKGIIKATNFTTFLNNGTQTLPKTKVTDGPNKIDVDFSKIKLPDYEPQPSTSKSQSFLEEAILEIPSDPPVSNEIALNTKSTGKLKNKSKKRIPSLEDNISNKVEFTILEGNSKLQSNEENILKNEDVNESVVRNSEMVMERSNIRENFSKDNIICENFSKIDNIDEGNKVLEKDEIEIQNITTEEVIMVHCNSNSETIKSAETNEYFSCNGHIDQNEILERILDTQNFDSELNAKIADDVLNTQISQTEMEQHIIIEIENECIEDSFQNDKKLEMPTIRQSVIIEIEDESTDNKDYSMESSLKSDESLEASPTKSNNDAKPLYPITQAVREWMTKTRETTPEIEILKSPDTIYKEFINNSDEEDSDTETDQKNGKSNPSSVAYLDQNDIYHNSRDARVAKSESDDEVTVFETWSISEGTNTQDCLENEIEEQKGTTKKPNDRKESIEEGEDVLEVYQSKYGKNEDFLRLKAEIEEQRRNGNFPKHGNLPYRAICCSLM